MKKSLFIIVLTFLAAFGVRADITADWSLHMPFDAWPAQIAETPTKVYFTSGNFGIQSNVSGRDFSSNSLYYYDKEGDEVVAMNERTNVSGNAVACMAYNYDAHYLLVVYTDCNIDFIYDDGRVFNVPALKITSIPGKKQANSISFDNTLNRAYVATTFGYVALSSLKHEVAESRNYGENIQSFAHCGDNIVICVDGNVYFAPATSQRFNLDDYSLIEDAPEVDTILPSADGSFYAYKSGGGSTYIVLFKWADGKYEIEKCADDNNLLGHQMVGGGYCVAGNVRVYFLYNNGSYTQRNRPEEEYGKPSTGLTNSNLWTLTERKGLRSYKFSDWNWSLTRDYMRPNAPATFVATSLYSHPKYGMLAGSNGVDYALNDFNQSTPSNISALKGGFWKEYGPDYAPSMKLKDTRSYSGLAVDPKNTDHVYRVKPTGGILRINLANPSDAMVFANPTNSNAGTDGFVQIAENQSSWNRLCSFTVPQFTADGTMWTVYNNMDLDRAELWYWPAASRLATTSAATYQPMKKIPLTDKFITGNENVMITLKNNPNVVALAGELGRGGTLMLYDHNGTPEITGDDRYVIINSPYDQDGGSVSFLAINSLFEDPSTGLLWILSQRGVFTVNPKSAFEDPTRVNRIKVARNDGTNLADYLLNEINVHSMSIDAEGRKWFSTSNGLVCTSADGKSILGEFTTENSYLPSDAVYATCYNAENNSMMVATDGGLVEMFPSGSGNSAGSDSAGVRVYPNPVEPDYYGWVRIDNVADGSLVKITDSTGGIVKELGPVSGGAVEWDVSGYNNSRVSTGVYYIMVSPGANSGGKTEITKILVLN